MNISQPISSEIGDVEFTFLSPREIKAISVKRIENDSTFDSLLNPVPGGLYDPALGSWGDLPCATCNLNQSTCPGHSGHIQLPVPCYHPVFIDQAYRLLRATCVYCKHFRLPRKDLHRYASKLRLIQHGLLHEAHIVDNLGESDWGADMDSEAEEAEADANDVVIRRTDKFVRQCLEREKYTRGDTKKWKHEGATEMRRHVIKDFLAEITKTRKCASCGGISPTYRKDRATKIFEKSLSDKESAQMAQKGLKWVDALAQPQRNKKALKRKPESAEMEAEAMDLDEHEVVNNGEVAEVNGEAEHSSSQRYISPMEVQARLSALFEKEQFVLSLVYNTKPPTKRSTRTTPDMFFVTIVLVPPNRYRPEARMGDSQISEAQQNSLYKSIIRGCQKIGRLHKDVAAGVSDVPSLYQAWVELQDGVNSLIDSNQNPVQGAAAARKEEGIKQKLEKKEGLFRKNMMGKRVNFAARSVISPDPNIETNEIGVPPVFAQKLTYPEPVTSHNFREMQQAVMNGVQKWPGAAAIENENGQVVNLRNKSAEERMSLANQLLASTSTSISGSGITQVKNKKVHRHLTNGDVVLMNRQPTLHKPSIMGHRVRVLQGEKTIRMHYANCNTYNADFDGDEMNMHFPQNEVARTEALQVADTDHQYLSGIQGKPLRGLIQDHISISVKLCNRDTVFNRSDYHQLIYSALRPESGHILGDRLELLPPAIIKPVPRWTGKQVITTILKNIQPSNCGPLTMSGQTQLNAKQWGTNSEEGKMLMIDGEFITGILDKSQIGPSPAGLVHAVHEVYGPANAGKFLSCLGRLLTKCLNMWAFSCGMDDLRLTRPGEASRRQALKAAESAGLKVASSYVSLEDVTDKSNALLLERLEEVLRDDTKQEGLDRLTNAATRAITDEVQKDCLPDGLEKPFPRNQMQLMTTSGAKGSRVNASLISCNLGQQVLESRRVPIMVSGKSLPCFQPFETNVVAHGYIVSRFLTGIRPQEYYFHHMAGREGLIDTAVKTSRSGYLQRCLIKGLEGTSVAYDSTVRDADGSIIQFLYGEDGLDVSKQKYLTDFDFILENVQSEAAQLRYDPKAVENMAANRKPFTKYMKSALKRAKAGDARVKDPLIAGFNPATNMFATSEQFYDTMATYLDKGANGLLRTKDENKPSTRLRINQKNAEMMFAMKYLRSLVEPGEAVGIVAGQSVGEPSTQMTLNTFHLAGHSANNVTQGIPRLREILMTASQNISTPSMTLYPASNFTDAEAEQFAKSISAVPFSYVLDRVTVEERSGKGKMYGQAKTYVIKFSMFPAEEYSKTYAISIAEVLATIERKLLRRILILMKAEIKKRKAQDASSATPEIGVSVGTVETAANNAGPAEAGPDEEDDDQGGDDDATNAKQRANRNEAVSYGDDDDEDMAVKKAMDDADHDMDDKSDAGEGTNGVSNGVDSDSDSDSDDDDDAAATAGAARSSRVTHMYDDVVSFESDEKGGEWCHATIEYDAATTPKVLMLNIVRDAIAKTLVREIRNIGACTFMKGTEALERTIAVSGSNLTAMQAFHNSVDLSRLQTNDIASMLSVYGVESCRSTIVKELSGVFGSHGIKVDNRHLNLIADHMTRNGGFTPFNRIGLKGNVSPFTKMSFETTLAFLKDALLDGDWDNLTTPSSRLAMGQLGRLGTGGFDVLTRLPTYHVNTMA